MPRSRPPHGRLPSLTNFEREGTSVRNPQDLSSRFVNQDGAIRAPRISGKFESNPREPAYRPFPFIRRICVFTEIPSNFTESVQQAAKGSA
jgi:hypothetical protein